MLTTLHTPGGSLQLPVFFPDATRGVVRGVSSGDLEQCGIQGVMVNVFHLLANPGVRTLGEQGGMHAFMNWRGPLAIDSGGFQAYSLLDGTPKLGSITKKGFIYRLEKDGKKLRLTPEKCVQAQFRLGGDILFALDYCTHPSAPAETQRASVELTVEWARICRREYCLLVERKQLPPERRPLLFAVVQGGEDPVLRRTCAERLLEIGFDGYSYGGWPMNEEGRLSESVAQVAQLVPPDRPRFALGIGKPENLVQAFHLGYDLFDCVIPSRDARRLRLYVFREPPRGPVRPGSDFYDSLYMQDKRFRGDNGPVEEGCDCPCCARYSRAYLYHLFRIGDSLGARLATLHNLRFYRRLVESLAPLRREDGPQ